MCVLTNKIFILNEFTRMYQKIFFEKFKKKSEKKITEEKDEKNLLFVKQRKHTEQSHIQEEKKV